MHTVVSETFLAAGCFTFNVVKSHFHKVGATQLHCFRDSET